MNKKEELKEKVKQAIQQQLINAYDKETGEKVEKSWDDYWFLIYDLMNENDGMRNCVDGNNEKFCEKHERYHHLTLDYEERAIKVAEAIIGSFEGALKSIGELIKQNTGVIDKSTYHNQALEVSNLLDGLNQQVGISDLERIEMANKINKIIRLTQAQDRLVLGGGDNK
jgi:hypothetical protein